MEIMRDSYRGMSLVEVILAVALAGGALLTLVTLFPAGMLSLQKARDLEAATAYGTEVLETSRRGIDQTATLNNFIVTINRTDFHVTRDFHAVSKSTPVGLRPPLYDVVVTVTWQGQPYPVTIGTRMPVPSAGGRP